MKATEMRLGNWYDHNGTPKQVTVSVIEDVWDAPRTWVKPIPLTEEWLVRLGATQDSISLCFKAIKIGGSVLNMNPDNGTAWIAREGNIINIPQLVLYVHQLQNLHHALTGEELTLKKDEK